MAIALTYKPSFASFCLRSVASHTEIPSKTGSATAHSKNVVASEPFLLLHRMHLDLNCFSAQAPEKDIQHKCLGGFYGGVV